MPRVSLVVLAAWITLVAALPGLTAPPWPTPEITRITALGVKDTVAYAMRAPLGESGEVVGLAVLCAQRDAAALQATAFFGAFPGAHHPVQLAVREPNGTVTRFGPVVAAGPASGFHSPQIRDPREAKRFVTAALQPGALISNGYRSFWNRASAPRNRQVRDECVTCVTRPRE